MPDPRPIVREALDNALVNGYDPRNARDAEYLAEDLQSLCADLEDFDIAVLTPLVQEWLVDHRSQPCPGS
jgi:hypothetical protein